jgi:hypothetical protein
VTRHGPRTLDPAQVAGFLTAMKFRSLENLPLEAFLAPMGLYGLEMTFDGSFARVPTGLETTYRAIVQANAVGQIASSMG